jgi:transcription initiation factor TFIIIB Brf1 subunit/transcription initiation factor TFIIB
MECLHENTINGNGHNVCTDCGLVIDHDEEFVDEIANDRSNDGFNQDTVGSFIHKGLRSTITRDGSITKTDMHRYHVSINSKSNKVLRDIFTMFDNLTKYSPKVIDTAKMFAETIVEHGARHGHTRGSNKKALLANCVYYACLYIGFSITPREVCADFDIDLKIMNKLDNAFRDIIEESASSYLLSKCTDRSSSYKELVMSYVQKYASEFQVQGLLENHYEIYKKSLLASVQGLVFRPQFVAIVLIHKIVEQSNNESNKESKLTKAYLVKNNYITYATYNRISAQIINI